MFKIKKERGLSMKRDRKEKFSIRKFSFGAASCLIGAQIAISGLANTAEAAFKQLNGEDGIVSLYSNSGETPESADGIQIGSKVNVDKEIGIDVDWSQYTRENPIVKVTYTYNGGADGSSVTGFGGHRPRFWFTTPIGLKEPKEITLKKNDGRPVYVMESWNKNKKFGSLSNSINSRFQTEDDINRAYTTPDFHGNDTKWESYNETTGEPYREYSGSFANKFWYHIGDRVSDNASEQALFEKFRTDTKTIYVDWERGGIERATITAVYEVADPTFGNDRRTLEFGAGFRAGIARMMQHYKTVLAPVPSLYKLNEIFEPDVPSRIAVTNPKSLTTKEKNTIKAKILEANKDNVTTIHRTAKNKLVENLFSDEETSIEIGADGKATIRYADNTIDEIPGTSLVYERPQIDNNETTPASVGDYKYLKNPYEVDDINNLKDTDVESAKSKFYTVNKMIVEKNALDEDVITAVGDPSKTSEDFKHKRLEIDKSTGIGIIYSGSTPIGVNIPKDHLFKQKPQKTFNIDEARQEAEKAIDNLTYLSPKEKQNFKTELASKTTQDDLNTVVNNAIAQNSSNEKALEAKKRDAKEAINNNPYLTNAQKKELTDKVSAVVMTDPTEGTATPIEHTKGLIDKILDEALEKTKEKAKAIIDEIDKKDGKAGYLTDPTADAYKERIKNAPSQAEITKIIGEAQSQVSKKAHDAEKAKTDALKDEYKKKIDQVPGLTDAQRDEYKKQIDAATTRDQLEAIVKDAEVKAYRDTAKAKIDALEHLNAAQKTELKTQVDAAGSKAEVDNIVSIAQGLDSKMDSLQKLVEKAKEVKGSEKYNTATQDKKDAFDAAKDAASKVADKATAEPENAAGTSEVATLIDNLAKAIKGLTGQDVAVPVSKDALKAELDLNKDDAVKKSPAYAKETDAVKKKAYDDALANAQKVYDKQDATQTDVDNALETLRQARLALSGKAEDFTLAVKDGAAKISVVPKAGDSLPEKDQPTVKAKLTANGKELDNTYTVKYGEIAEKGGKTVVPVTVTHDGITRTVDVPVEGTDAAKSPLNDPEKVKVNNINNLTEKEKAAVKEAVKKANPNLTDDKITVDGKGNVTVTYSDTSHNELTPDKTVVAKTEAEKALDKAKEKGKSDLTEAANKEKAEIEADKNLTDQQKTDKKAEVDKVKKEQEANIDKAQTTDEVAKATEAGKKAIDAVHKTELDKAKEQAKSDLTAAANKEKAEIDADKNLTDQQKADKKAEVDKVKKEQEANIDKAQTTDAVAKATEEGKKAIDAVHQTELEKAKADLTDAANTEKGEIGGDTTLTDKEKEDLKAKVDEVKKAAEDKINNAKTPEEIAKATEEGKKAIADVYNPQTSKGKSTSIFKAELDLQTALVSGKATVEKGKDLTDEEILKQLALADGVTAKITSKPTTTETGTKEAEVEVTLADGTKVTVKVPVEVVESLEKADKDNDLAKAKEDAKKQVEEAAKKKLDEIKKDKDLTAEQKQKAEEAINKAKEDAKKAIDEASSAGTAKQIADEAKENIEKYNPKADTEVKKPDVTNLDEEKAKAKAEVLEEAQKRINEIKNNKDVSDEEKQKAIDAINKAKDKAIEDINKGQSKDEIDAAKDNGIKKINEVQPEGSIASKFEPKVPENKVEVKNPTKLSDEEKEKVRQNIEGVNTFPDGTTVDVKPDGTAVITYKDGSSDTISKDKLVAPAKKDEGTIASRTEPVIPGKTQVGNTTKLTPEEQAAVKKAVEDANKFPAGTTVEVRPDGTVVITYPDKSVDTITGDKLVEKGSKQTIPKVKTEAEKNPAQVPGRLTPVENTHSLTPAEQSAVATKVKQANPTATDVKVSKDGTATLTYGDGSVNTIPGTSLVVAKDTDKEVATQAAQNPAVAPATTEVGNTHNLTPEEQAAVATKVKATNPTATDVKVSKDGTATLTYGDGSVNTIPGTSLVIQKEEVATPDQPTIAEKTKVIIPANPTKVVEATRLTDEEKEAVRKAVAEANGFGSDVKVEVAGDGTATIVFPDGSAITIPGTRLVAQDPKAQDSNKTDAEKTTVKAPAQRVDVKDITHLTDEEKEKVKVAILQANGSALDGVTIEVAGDGTATITFPDGSVATILGKDTVQQSAKTEPAIHEKPEYTPESTPDQDNGGNTGRLDDNANSGNGSNAGTANAGDNNASKEDAKGGIQGALAKTGLDNPGGLAGLGLAMLGGLLVARRRKEK